MVAVAQQFRLAHFIGPQLFQPFGILVQGGGGEHQDQCGNAHHIVGGVGRGDGGLAGLQAHGDGGQVGAAAGVGAHEHAGHLPAFVDLAGEQYAEHQGRHADAEHCRCQRNDRLFGQLAHLFQVQAQQADGNGQRHAVAADGIVGSAGGGHDPQVGHHDAHDDNRQGRAQRFERLEPLQPESQGDRGDHDEQERAFGGKNCIRHNVPLCGVPLKNQYRCQGPVCRTGCRRRRSRQNHRACPSRGPRRT